MEESLVTSAIDLSGRMYMVFQAAFSIESKIGEFDSELIEEFWNAFASNALCNLHIVLHHGRNSHHIAKRFSRALRDSERRLRDSLRQAIEFDPRQIGVPSTKGTLGVKRP